MPKTINCLRVLSCGLLAGFVTVGVLAESGSIHARLERLDIPMLAADNRPDWQVPDPLQAEHGPVVAEETLTMLEGGYRVHAQYVWTDGQWHWLGISVRDSSLEDDDRPGVQRLGRGRYSDLAVEALRSDAAVPVAERRASPCTDDPAARAPHRDRAAHQAEHIDNLEMETRWKDSSTGCAYRAKFRFEAGGRGEPAWSLVEFAYTLVGDVIPEAGDS